MYLLPNVSLKSKKIIFVVKCFIYNKYSFLITNYRQSNVILYPFTDSTMYCVNDLVRTRKLEIIFIEIGKGVISDRMQARSISYCLFT